MWDRKAERIAKYNKKKQRLDQRKNKFSNTGSKEKNRDLSKQNRRTGLLRD
jgi:hypothetical protein